jgi:glycolate oxidase FAD binding subunit
VTGFDLMRLHHGALGTLGVIVSANFKVLPLARADSTVVLELESMQSALDIALRVLRSRVQPAALEVVATPLGWQVAVRLLGRSSTVSMLRSEVLALAGVSGTVADDDASEAWWRRHGQEFGVLAHNDALIRFSSEASLVAELAANVVALLNRIGSSPISFRVSPGLGLVDVRIPPPNPVGDESSLATLQRAGFDIARQCVILAAPPESKVDLDVWGREPESIDVMRSLKMEFDPARTLNPGRFASRI